MNFMKKMLFYGYFDIKLIISVYFHVKEVKCIQIKPFVSAFALIPVLVAILNLSILTGFERNFSPNVLMTQNFVLRRSKPMKKAT